MKEDIASFWDVVDRLLSVMSGAGIEYWFDYTWGTGGSCNYWVIDDTGWYSGDVELKIYLRFDRNNPTKVEIKWCRSISFYDVFDKEGNYIGRDISVVDENYITSLSGTGTCYYSYAPRVAYLATPSSYVLFFKTYSVRGDMTEQMWTVNMKVWRDYPSVGDYAGFWRYTSDPLCIATSKIATQSKHTWNTYDNVYYCTAPDWSVFYIPGRGYFFKVKGYNIALPAVGDEGTYLGEAIECEWTEIDSIDEPEFYLDVFSTDVVSEYYLIEKHEEIDEMLQEIIREHPEYYPQVGQAVLEKAKRVISKMTFE